MWPHIGKRYCSNSSKKVSEGETSNFQKKANLHFFSCFMFVSNAPYRIVSHHEVQSFSLYRCMSVPPLYNSSSWWSTSTRNSFLVFWSTIGLYAANILCKHNTWFYTSRLVYSSQGVLLSLGMQMITQSWFSQLGVIEYTCLTESLHCKLGMWFKIVGI